MSERRAELLGALTEIERITERDDVSALARRVRARVDADGASAMAVVGRRGAGKTSLLEALSNERAPRPVDRVTPWRVAATPELLWLDAPGFRGREPWDPVAEALAAWSPAATLFVVPATEVDALGDDAAVLRGYLDRFDDARRGCLVAVNKVDELEPVDDHAPPFAHPRKGFHIAEASARARWNLARRGVDALDAVPVSALMVRRGASVLHDGRWNLAALTEAARAHARSIPRAWGVAALARDVRALAEAHAAEAAAMDHDGRREVAAGRIARLLGADAAAMFWTKTLVRRSWSLNGLARARVDLAWLTPSAR